MYFLMRVIVATMLLITNETNGHQYVAYEQFSAKEKINCNQSFKIFKNKSYSTNKNTSYSVYN